MNMRKANTFCIVLILGSSLAGPAHGGAASKAAREAAEAVLRKFGAKTVREGSESLAERITASDAKHGDEVYRAVQRVGPRAMNLADEAGPNAGQALRLLSKHGDDPAEWVIRRQAGMKLAQQYGDDAAEVLIKHKGIAEPILENLGKPAVEALGAVGPQGGRRLAMMAQSGDLAKIGQVPEVMTVISKYGDPAMDFIWRNKKPLAVGTTLTAFLSEPQAFIEGTTQLAGIAGTTLVQPVVQETARAFSWVLRISVLLLVAGGGGAAWLAIRYPESASAFGKLAIRSLIRQPKI
jgi:hypothetical protein